MTEAEHFIKDALNSGWDAPGIEGQFAYIKLKLNGNQQIEKDRLSKFAIAQTLLNPLVCTKVIIV